MAKPQQPSAQCPKCGAILVESARFCVECGSLVPGPQTMARTAAQRAIKTTAPGLSASAQAAITGRKTLKLDVATTVGAPMHNEPQRGSESVPATMAEALNEATGSPANQKPPTVNRAAGRSIRGGSAAPATTAKGQDDPPISDILEDIDTTFETILKDPASVPQSSRPEDLAQAGTLFKQITGAYIGPVRDFMIELEMGEPPKEWIQVCAPALASLQSSAERIGMPELAAALAELRTALERAEAAPGDTINADARERVLASSKSLVSLLPDAFAVSEERDRREPIIVRSLLCQVPLVRKVQLDRIYRAGITSLSMLYVASAWDLAQTTGLGIELCEQIVEKFNRYKKGSVAPTPGMRRDSELSELGRLAGRLRELNAAYDGRARKAGSYGLDKKQARQQRNQTMLEINVVLARLGEVDLVGRLERLPFERKVDEVERYVSVSRELNKAITGQAERFGR